MKIVDRDIEVLQALERFRFLNLQHIRTLAFSSSASNVRRRLGLLEKAGYIGKRDYYSDTGRANYFFLRRVAYQYLDSAYKQKKPPSPAFLPHRFGVTTIQIKLESIFPFNGYELVYFTPETEKRHRDGRTETPIYDRLHVGGQVIDVRPDAAFVLKTPQDVRVLYLLEHDRQTEDYRKIKDKFDSYDAYAGHPERFTKKHQVTFNRFLVLFVTTTEKRIRWLQRRFSNHTGFRHFLFSTLDDLKGANDPTAPIWTREPEKKIGLM